MTNNAQTLRNLVLENRFETGRVSKEKLGGDYDTLTAHYRTALDTLTEWASKDYAHNATDADLNACFVAIKNILNLFATDTDRIIIDHGSMRTMRDCATKPKRLYSAEYAAAAKALREANKTLADRTYDLEVLGAPARKDDESVEAYVARVRDTGVNVTVHGVDMLSMYQAASSVVAVKAQAVQTIKDRGHWAWKRPVAVPLNEFAELVENYIGDCLEDGYNIKPSKVVREEQAAARAEAKAAKAQA